MIDANAQQKFIDDAYAKMETENLGPNEVQAIVIGRCMTLLAQNIEELKGFVSTEANEITKANCASLAGFAEGMYLGMQRQIEMLRQPLSICIPGARLPRRA